MTFLTKYFACLAIGLILLITWVALGKADPGDTTHLHAQHWYDWDCCHHLDCARATKYEIMPDGSEIITSPMGTVRIGVNFPVKKRRESKSKTDNDVHVCMRPPMSEKEHKEVPEGMKFPLCVYYPRGS